MKPQTLEYSLDLTIDELWLMNPVERMGQARLEFIPACADSVREKFLEILP